MIKFPLGIFILLFSMHLRAGNTPPLPAAAFTENKGQIVDQYFQPNPDVLFLLSGPGIRVQLRKTGYSYELFSAEHLPASVKPLPATTMQKATLHVHRVDVEFEGMNRLPEVIAEQPQAGLQNYFTYGHEATGIRSFGKVTYRNVYPNIDIEFVVGENKTSPLKYNIVLHAGATLAQVRFLIHGASELGLSKNSLELATTQGTIREHIPLSYYTDTPGRNEPVQLVLENNRLSFSAAFDPARTLVIDPSSNLIWSTYYAGSSVDVGTSVATDSQDNVYMAGHTLSPGNMATANSFQSTIAGSWDGFLVKFDPNGTRQWATYIGGTGLEQIYAMHIDKTDAIYVTGDTGSPSNIASQGVFQTVYGGGVDDMLLVRFNSGGQRVWATYFGGSEHEFAQAVTVDRDGDVIIAGHTGGTTNLATPNAFNTTYNFLEDGVIAKFTSSGQRLWCTYYGDSGNDIVYGLSTDSFKNVYATGITSSIAGISTGSSHQPLCGGSSDGFLAKFNPAGTALLWGTYYGGTGKDEGTVVRIAPNNQVYLCGNTESPAGIASASAYQPVASSAEDGFLACFNPSGQRQWATYTGGNGTDYISDMELDGYDNLVFCGQTLSTNSIATAAAYQPTLNGVNFYDAYFAKWSKLGQPKLGTYFGATGNENARGMALDRSGKVYIGGETSSASGLATAAAHQTVGVGSGDAFLAKFCMDIEPVISPPGGSTLCVGSNTISTATYSTYQWSNGYTVNPMVVNLPLTGVYNFSVFVTDGFGCSGSSGSPGNYLVTVLPCTTSLEDYIGATPLELFPVPTDSKIMLSGEWTQPVAITVTDVSGRELPVRQVNSSPITLDVHELPAGLYFIRVESGNSHYVGKFVRQ